MLPMRLHGVRQDVVAVQASMDVYWMRVLC